MRPLPSLLAAAVLASGCNLTIPLDVTEEYRLAAPAGRVAVAQAVDLAEQETLWSEREKVEGIEVTRVEVEVISVAGPSRASRVDLALRLRPEGAPPDGSADVPVATLAVAPVVAGQGAAAEAPGNALGTAILSALRGTGRFTLVLDGEVDDVLDATFQVRAVGTVDLGID